MRRPIWPSTAKGAGRIVEGVGSAVLLATLLIAAPLILVGYSSAGSLARAATAVGRPHTIIETLGTPLTLSMLSDLATGIAWMTWSWLMVCLVMEIVARWRGHTPRSLPASRRAQAVMALMVGAILALGANGRSSTIPRIGDLPIEAVSLEAVASGYPLSGPMSHSAEGTSLSAVQLATSGQRAAGTIEYTVVRGDSLWSIASEKLGSPLRWKEIAALNYGRVQPDGRVFDNDNWIFPGWKLELPVVSLTPVPSSLEPPEVSQEEREIHSTAYEREGSTDSAITSQPRDDRMGSDPTLAASHRPNGDPDSHSKDRAARKAHGEHPTMPIEQIGYGVLGAGVIAMLVKMRRRQQRYRRRGYRISLPSGDLVALEASLRFSSDQQGVDWLDIALRALVAEANRWCVPAPRVVGARLEPEFVELVFGSAARPDEFWPPFVAGAEPNVWRLYRNDDNLQKLRDNVWIARADAPFPSMVTAGRDESGLLLVDLEHAGSLCVRGDAPDQVLNGMILELATVPWAENIEIIAIGFDDELSQFDRVRTVEKVSDILARTKDLRDEREALLSSVGKSTNWEPRVTVGGDGWDLTLIFCGEAAGRAEISALDLLARYVGDGAHGAALVTAADCAATNWSVACTNGRLTFNSGDLSGIEVWPQRVEASVATDVGTMIGTARDIDGVNRSLLEKAPISNEDPAVDHGLDGVEVKVLGPVEVHGAEREFTRAWTLDLVVYLAMHPAGASTDQWSTALWPDRLMAPSSLHSTASAARRSLGVDESGRDHLPRSHGRLALARTVTTDCYRFELLSKSDDPDQWKAALHLIRGRPFEGLRATDWTLLEGIVASIEASVVDLSCRFVEYHLGSGNPAEASWGARQGLRVSAYDERLYRALMRAADAAGNPAGVHAVFMELVSLVAVDIEPYDAVHPETLDLYRELSRGSGTIKRRQLV